jgi:DNA-binding transcriptional regulator YbjK
VATDRRQQICDAAIEVLGAGGSRRLTHRAVDSAAGLPSGSTSNVFRTRGALLAGVLDRLLERETEGWRRFTTAGMPREVDTFAALLAGLIEELTGPQRMLSLARQAIFHEAAFRPELQRRIDVAQRDLLRWGGAWLAALGSNQPERDLRALLALIDGVLLLRLANPHDTPPTAPMFAALLRGLRADVA